MADTQKQRSPLLSLLLVLIVAPFAMLFMFLFMALWLRWQERANRAGLRNRLRQIFTGLCLIWIASCAWLSKHRVAVWSSNITLWSDTVNKVPLSSLAQNNLGQAFQNQGNMVLIPDEGINFIFNF